MSQSSSRWRTLIASGVFCLFTVGVQLCWGQSTTSTITGRITDPSGALVPDAAVAVVNSESGVRTETRTNESGLYRVPSLSPGAYRVEVEIPGFQRLVRRGIVLQVSQTLALDLVLEVGNITETVDVTASAPVVESESSTMGQLVERNMIEGMPLPNRAATAMVILSPAAVVINQGSGGENIPIFAVGGGRVRNQSYSLDGGNATNVVGLAVPQQQNSLPMDAMQEFRIISNNYAAEHGHSTSGVITLSTRSGTNMFHGSLFEYARNDAFDARNFFSATKPRLRMHQFGGSFGGPIIKDKTHFFGSWEGTRQTTGGTSIQTVPTPLQRSGDFSQTLNTAGKQIVIYDPATTAANKRQPFPGNVIPSDTVDPVAAAITPFWPQPNRSGNIAGASNFSANSKPKFRRDIVVARLDHQFRPSDQLMVRYYINDNATTNPGVFGDPDPDPAANLVEGRSQNILGAYTHIFTASLINEFRFSHLRRKNNNQSFGLDANYASQIGLSGVSDVGFPRLTMTGFAALGRATKFRFQSPIEDTQIQDAVSFYRGKHAFKFGVEYRFGANLDDTDTSSSGNFAFTPLYTGQPGNSQTGSAMASFLLGQVHSASTVRADTIQSRAAYWAWYAQDDWRVTDRLTLNLGLRWEVGLPRTVDENRMNAFNTTATNPVSGTPGIVTFAGRDGVPTTAWDADYNNFGPRFGFAYRLPWAWTTVVRGGAGIFYGPSVSNIVATAASLGFSTDVSLASAQAGIVPAMVLREGFPAVSPDRDYGPGFGAVPVGTATNTSVSFFERARPMPISLQYNFNIQHAIRENLLLEFGYLANLSHHLTSADDLTINQVPPELMGAGNAQIRRPFPQFTNVTVLNPPLGNSTYHAMTLKTEKRYSAGLTFLAHYTFSKYIDDAESFSEFGDSNSYMDAYNRSLDKGLSGSDVRHRGVISGVYELPFWRDKPGALAYAIAGWKVGALAALQSGPTFTVYNNSNTTNAFSAGSLRPNIVGDPVLSESERSIDRWFNTDAFVAPAQYTFGNAPRSVLRGPGIIGVDLSLTKNFRITERFNTEFRGEFFNLPNHTNLGVPGHSLGTAAFGTISGARDARTIQLSLRITF